MVRIVNNVNKLGYHYFTDLSLHHTMDVSLAHDVNTLTTGPSDRQDRGL